ncbi:hypothetical protein Cgig2_003274 [Carnegiea gigantea]|uniref:PIN-like protein n=1 Tax=Carnegiea gigantea TaxID=171969 RepID=A0A9Q1JGR7_9CARY|nr:hypothetical protein Cgig2_003274 [Carnegiea gigantea]
MAESFLSKLYEGKMEGEGFFVAIKPLLKLITLTLIGVILGHPEHKLIPRGTFRLLSKLVFALFLPCLIFTNLGQSITLKNFTLWWFIPVNVVLSTAIGSALGYVVALICKPPPQFFRLTVIMTAMGNTGNLPLAIITSVCHTKNHPFGPECRKNGVAYASFAQWVAVTLVYTFVYHMMEPPIEYYDVVEEETDECEIEEEQEDHLGASTYGSDLSIPLLYEAEWPGVHEKETEHSKTPLIYRVFNSLLGDSITSVPDFGALEEDPKTIRCLAEPKVVRKIRTVAEQTPIQNILQPPTVASLLAITIGMVPQFKSLVYGDEAALSFITDSFQILSGAMVPSVMLVLGGMLAEGPDRSRLGVRTTVGIIVARLLVLPLIGIGVLVLAGKLGMLLEGDQMFRFVILLHYVTPSAILLGAIASLRGYAVEEASALLFWQHPLIGLNCLNLEHNRRM